MVLEAAIQDFKGKTQATVIPIYDPYEKLPQSAQHSNTKVR